MTPQDSFLVLAPLAAGRESELRSVLASMNSRPGSADPRNPILPFAAFDRLHFARFVILEDPAPDDVAAHGLPPEEFPPTLAFFGECDGAAKDVLAEMARRAEPGLRRLFSCCKGFLEGNNLLGWLKEHQRPNAAAYVNHIGRTVRQIREEAALYDELRAFLDARGAALDREPPQQIRRAIIDHVEDRKRVGALVLTAEERTPLGWQMRNLLHLAGVPLVLLAASPFVVVALPVLVHQLRSREKRDPEITPRPDSRKSAELAAHEDLDVTNPYIVFGRLKPGLFRLWNVIVLLWLADYAARHVYNRGFLTRVQTIHFARWAFVDDKKRMFFASNYDGALESYMDDFINKVGWGLNVLFSNGLGYPRTNWLINGGAQDEQKFKYYIRRHQLMNEVWYKAYPGLTAFDLARNGALRKGIEKPAMTDAEIRSWLSLI